MQTVLDVLRNHPSFDPKTQTDIPDIEEIYAANVMTYEQARAIQIHDAEASKGQRNETEGDRLEREAQQLRNRMRYAGVPEMYLDVPADMTYDLSGRIGVMLYGCQGSGKTTKAASILKGWMTANHGSAWFIASADLLTEIGATYSSYESEKSVLDKYGKCKLLVIDDLGQENPTDQALTKLWQVINARYVANLPTVVTTQFDLSDLVREMSKKGAHAKALSIVSRLYERSKPVSTGNVDHRRRNY